MLEQFFYWVGYSKVHLKNSIRWVRHILKGESLVKEVIEGQMEGREEEDSNV